MRQLRSNAIIDQVGELRKYPYNQETETIQSLVNQLKENYMTQLENTGLIEAVNQLDLANQSFNDRFGTRATEVSGRPDGDVRKERVRWTDLQGHYWRHQRVGNN